MSIAFKYLLVLEKIIPHFEYMELNATQFSFSLKNMGQFCMNNPLSQLVV